MKKVDFITAIACLGLSLGLLHSLTACQDTTDGSAFATKAKLTATDHLDLHPEKFSAIRAIFGRVRLGKSREASPLASVLSARGNYTIFAPNDTAVAAYIKSLGVTSVADLTEEQARLIAYSCIIDNGNDAPYEEMDFPDKGSFAIPNLNDRMLTCAQDTVGMTAGYIINGVSHVVAAGRVTSNAIIHEVDAVIAPSSDNLYERIADAGNMRIMSRLMALTGWADSLSTADRDKAYEETVRDEQITVSSFGTPFKTMAHRYIGFTAFIEPDEVYASDWGVPVPQVGAEGHIANWDDIMAVVRRQCEAAYGTSDADNLKSPHNAVNRFVAYHFVYGKMAYNRFVFHYNEYNYKFGDRRNPQTKQCPVNVWDTYVTLGQYPSLLKITQVGDQGFEQDVDHKIYINRFSVYNDGRRGDYTETGVRRAGIRINADNGADDNDALNGYYYPIGHMLLYDNATRNLFGNERLRIETAAMFPEIASNNVRLNGYYYFPRGYLDNVINESASTQLLYVCEAYSDNVGWATLCGDDLSVTGLFDLTVKLPPVAVSGTYEIRIGTSHNALRGMAQIYFGSDPYRMHPAGLPYDMRQPSGKSAIPWVADVDDDITNIEIDKQMRNQGYMKAPMYFTVTNGQADRPVRHHGGTYPAIRRIISVEHMDAYKTYYVRFKSALKKLDSQFVLDYFEMVPTSVCNGIRPEDIW